MATLTPDTIAKVAWNAGFGRDVPTLARAVAIALAESGGNPNAHNGNAATGDDSYGLWQINMIGSMGPARRKQFGITSNAELYDPQINANAAWKLSSSGRVWSPWSVFKNGTYTKHMATAETAAKAVIAGAPGPDWVYNLPGMDAARSAGQAIGAATDGGVGAWVGNAVNAMTQSLFKAGINTGAVLLAVVLFILGVAILMRGPIQRTTREVAKVAGVVAPQGKIAKVAGKAAKLA